MPTPATPPRPLIELHRHLEGSMRPSTYVEFVDGRGGAAALDRAGRPTAISLASPAPDLPTYLERLEHAVASWTTLDDTHRVAREAVEDADREGLDHLELRFSPLFIATLTGLGMHDVADAVIDGVAAGCATTGLNVSLIGILSRTFGPEATARELAAILAHGEQLRGIDLAGDEAGWPCALFAEQVETARRAGLRVTVHAGEGAGADSVREALDHLRPERIGHGVRAVEDPRLLERLASTGVVLEVALTSNVHTSTFAGLDRHPVRALGEAGVALTLNTDNPTVSRIDLPGELSGAARAAGLTPRDLDVAARTAAEAAFVDDDERARLRALAG